MTTDFQCHRLTVQTNKILTIAAFLSALLAIQVFGGTAMAGGSYEPPKRPKLAPLINEKVPNRIPDQYIIIFKPGTSSEVALAAQNKAKDLGGTIRTTYILEPIGFSAKLSEQALQVLRKLPEVDFIEVNASGSLDTIQILDPNNWPKGLDRTSERGIPPQQLLDGRYTFSERGAGVHVYVIDTGIFSGHSEFGGRVQGGTNVTNNPALGTDDCSGHGTHVAGIIGGATFGIAKDVTIHPVRYINCVNESDNVAADFAAQAVEWVTGEVRDKRKAGDPYPAVVNFSSSFPVAQAGMLNQKVRTSMDLPLTYVVSAGNNNAPACNLSPANIKTQPKIPPPQSTYNPVVVGAINPNNDHRWDSSNIGPCVDLFAPGYEILSAMPDNKIPDPILCHQVSTTSGSQTMSCSGTSMAAPHVTGVVARILSRGAPNNPLPSPLTPDNVWNAIHLANNHAGTSGWAGVGNAAGTNSPNEMLHYGSASDGKTDGDTHITTINEIHYDFQAAGEFVALRDANGMEIQTRQTSVPSAPWVSVNTAIAARVGQRRVTWEPNISGVPDPSGLQLRVDGVVTAIGENGLDLGEGGRIMKSAAGDILEVGFPDGTALFVASHWWADQSQWYLDVNVFHTSATEGIMGHVEQDSWLQPQFAETWRVTNETSLFDYAPGLSTKTFTIESFPEKNIPPISSEVLALARRVCESIADPAIADHNRLADCAFDIAVTGDPIFAKSHRIAQRIQRGVTNITVRVERTLRRIREEVTLIATVTRHGSGTNVPTGSVMFLLDGKPVGKPAQLDSNGQTRWKTRHIIIGEHRVAGKYIPDKDSVFLSSRSLDEHHTVEKRGAPHKGTVPKKLDKK